MFSGGWGAKEVFGKNGVSMITRSTYTEIKYVGKKKYINSIVFLKIILWFSNVFWWLCTKTFLSENSSLRELP
jgi:hypothetical protein